MPTGIVAGIAGGAQLLGSAIGSKGASEAAQVQSDVLGQAKADQLALQKQIYEEQTARLDPFRQVGLGGLAGLAKLSTPGGQAEYLENYYQSPSFQAQSQAAQQQQLAAAEATGGLQSTSTQNQLARISPTLGQQALQQQLGAYGNLTNIGLSGAGAQASYAGQYGAGASNVIGQTAQALAPAQASAAAYPYQAIGGGIQQAGGLFAGGRALGLF